MKSRISLDGRNVVLILLLVTFPLKAWYMLSRPLFFSGPDGPRYISSTIDFGTKNFFSSAINGMPNWPAGYPWLQSLVYRLDPGSWIELIQILQLTLFSVSIFLLFRFFTPILGERIASITSILLILSPAWAVTNGESMYETLLWFFTVLGFYLMVTKSDKVSFQISGAVSLGIAIVIHPRIIPFIAIFLITVFRVFDKTPQRQIQVFSMISIFPIIFLLRNKVSEGIFTLSDALLPSILGYRPRSMAGCGSLSCVPETILQHPIEFLRESFYNLFAFWSPHSGPLERGSWFHNVSLLSALERVSYSQASFVLSLILMSLLVIFAVAGFLIAVTTKFQDWLFFILGLVYFMGTDFIIFGDNRHRLIAMIITLPLQILGFSAFTQLGKKLNDRFMLLITNGRKSPR